MTRWARAGSTQKHKKMPEDPTPWEEFARQQKSVKTEKKFLIKKDKKVSNEAAMTSLKKKLKQRLKTTKVKETHHESSPLIEEDLNEVSLMSESRFTADDPDSVDRSFKKDQESKVCNKKSKRKKDTKFPAEGKGVNAFLKDKKFTGMGKFSKTSVEASVPDDSKNLCTNQTNLIESFKKKHKIGKKKFMEKFQGESFSSDAKLISDEESEIATGLDLDSTAEKAESTESSPRGKGHLISQKKHKSFLEKVKEKRAKNGILLLPNNVENKLYRMKKSLRAKGFSGEQVKDIIRKARRKAELNYRKTLKTCFNCREIGHVLANCPKVIEDNEQGTGICFKCGSTEHVSSRCHIKTSEFPFAKCFVCHNIGHLSRNCPENQLGIYLKGGKCNLCGSIYHLRKDCPKSFNKKKDEDEEITAHTINELRSVDDEIVEMECKTVKQKGPKLVKF